MSITSCDDGVEVDGIITSASVEDPYEYPGQGHGGAGYQYHPTITPPDT